MQLQRSWGLFIFCLCVAAMPAVAHAQDSAAEVLFEEGRSLVVAGRFAEACPKFEESQRLDPGVGTQFNLADCYEKLGRPASAWSQFKAAESHARAQGQGERAGVAARRAEALASRLARLSIQVQADAQIEGLKVTRDGVEVGPAQWGVGIPVDPGEHRITATAPGKLPFDRLVRIGGSTNEAVTIPILVDAPKEAVVGFGKNGEFLRAGEAPSGSTNKSRTAWTLSLAGVSLVGLAAGTVFGLSALSKNRRSEDNCNGNLCTIEGGKARSDARLAGNFATVGFIVAGLAGGAAATVYFTSTSKTAEPEIVGAFSPSSAALQVRGRF